MKKKKEEVEERITKIHPYLPHMQKEKKNFLVDV